MKIDVSEGIDINKTNPSKECISSQYWYCLNKGLIFDPGVCNRCHEILMMSMILDNIAILNVYGVDFCYILLYKVRL